MKISSSTTAPSATANHGKDYEPEERTRNHRTRHGARHAAGSYWRHAAELRGEVALDPERHREFPSESVSLIDATGRRNFMKVMGASMMMAGLAGCARQPEEKIALCQAAGRGGAGPSSTTPPPRPS